MSLQEPTSAEREESYRSAEVSCRTRMGIHRLCHCVTVGTSLSGALSFGRTLWWVEVQLWPTVVFIHSA